MPGIRSTRPTLPLDRGHQRSLAAVLGLVHQSRGASRAELTQATGLNRSTIAALVGELAEFGLIREGEPASSNRVGRPSPFVTADPRVLALTVNPEIDAVTVGVVGLDGLVQRRIRVETESVPTVSEAVTIAADTIRGLGRELPDAARIVGIGVAMPGLVRRRDGLVRMAPHLGWVDEPFSDLLAEATGLTTWADNDASLGARAESIFGAGRGVADLVYLNGGASGVGGGILVDGRPLGGRDGYAGELGHTLVNSAGTVCHCGALGCLETEVGQARLLEALGRDRGDDDELDRRLRAAVDRADAQALAEVRRQAGFLGLALRNIVNAFNPEAVVLGGFLGALYGAAAPEIESFVAATGLRGPRESVRISRAALGSERLLIGAAELAFAELLSAPRP